MESKIQKWIFIYIFLYSMFVSFCIFQFSSNKKNSSEFYYLRDMFINASSQANFLSQTIRSSILKVEKKLFIKWIRQKVLRILNDSGQEIDFYLFPSSIVSDKLASFTRFEKFYVLRHCHEGIGWKISFMPASLHWSCEIQFYWVYI